MATKVSNVTAEIQATKNIVLLPTISFLKTVATLLANEEKEK
jgi:hypothetical protein